MPIYEYLCEGCGRVSELMQKMSDPPPRSCPECGSRKIAKLVSRTAFQLKGGGWYADLYASTNKEEKARNASAEAPAKTDSGDATKTAPATATATATPAGDKPAPAKKPAKPAKASTGRSGS